MPDWNAYLRAHLPPFSTDPVRDADIREELAQHLEQTYAEALAAGASPEEAFARATMLLPQPPVMGRVGQSEALTQAIRRADRPRRPLHLPNVLPDLRYGLRLLARAPGFAAAAILTVALGIAVTTAIFSIVYGVLLRPLPFPDPDRLVSLWSSNATIPRGLVGAADARDRREQTQAFAQIALIGPTGNFNVTRDGQPERLQAARVTANFLRTLGTAPLLGRDFRDGEDEIGHDTVAILSHALWQRRYNGDASVIGKTILLNDAPHTIVGVMGPSFQYPSRAYDLWKPLTVNPADYRTRDNWSFIALARLKPDMTIAQGQADMDAITARLNRLYPDAGRNARIIVSPLHEDTVRDVRTALSVLLGAVGLLLLIGCANLANLLLACAVGRRMEYAVRGALGASRARLVLQSLGEVLPIVAIGGALGLLFALWLLRALLPFLPASMPHVESIALNGPVLMFAVGALTMTVLLCGLLPAMAVSRGDLAGSMRAITRSGSGSAVQTRLRGALVLAQIAAAVMLTAGAGLLVRTFTAVRQIDPGFHAEGALTLHLAIPRVKYGSDENIAAYTRRLVERVAALPGVTAAGVVNRLPLAGGSSTGLIILDRPTSGIAPGGAANGPQRGSQVQSLSPEQPQQFHLRSASPDYFRAMGIPLLQGRTFTDADDEDAPPVVVIDDRLARLAWPDRDPIGQRLRGSNDAAWSTVIGVVSHVAHDRLEDDDRPQVYWSYLQSPRDRMAMVVRATVAPESLAQPITAAIREIDPQQPVYDVRTLEQLMDRAVSQRWLNMMLVSAFAVAAVLLASIGIYGVLAYAVTQRVREFGIRLALGATRGDVMRLVLRQALLLATAGVTVGLAGALLLARGLRSLLFQVGAYDVSSFATAVTVLIAVALIAALVPARRAARTDPMHSLRAD